MSKARNLLNKIEEARKYSVNEEEIRKINDLDLISISVVKQLIELRKISGNINKNLKAFHNPVSGGTLVSFDIKDGNKTLYEIFWTSISSSNSRIISGSLTELDAREVETEFSFDLNSGEVIKNSIVQY